MNIKYYINGELPEEIEMRRKAYDKIDTIYNELSEMADNVLDIENPKKMERYASIKRLMSDIETCLMIVQ